MCNVRVVCVMTGHDDVFTGHSLVSSVSNQSLLLMT